jgi:hypothetical protein
MKNKHIKREGLKQQYLEAKICNVIDYLSFFTLQTGNITLVKFGGRNITSQSLSDLNLPLKKNTRRKKGNRDWLHDSNIWSSHEIENSYDS